MIYLFSCKGKEEDKRMEDIQGEWVFDSSGLRSIDSVTLSRVRETCGFLFKENTCDLRCRIDAVKTDYICYGSVPGYKTQFQIHNDSLKIWYADELIWRSFFINSLSKDSMVLVSPTHGYNLKFVRPRVYNRQKDFFDEIVVHKFFLVKGTLSPDELLRGYTPIVFLRSRLADGGVKEWRGDIDTARIKRLWTE